jgi:hypothetical protein
MLDAELDKVTTFYAEREKEMHERAKLLKQQLKELEVHRQMFYVGGLYCGWHIALNSDPVRNHWSTRRPKVGPREHTFLSHLHFRR